MSGIAHQLYLFSDEAICKRYMDELHTNNIKLSVYTNGPTRLSTCDKRYKNKIRMLLHENVKCETGIGFPYA